MTAPIFIGDEVSAAGFRLAGVRIRTPLDEDLPGVITWANKNTSLIIITAEYLNKLDQGYQRRLISQLQPPVAVVSDIRLQTPVEDLATRLRSQLGVLE